MIRSATAAQLLIDNGLELAATTTEATVRPLSTLPAALQPVGWQLIQAVSLVDRRSDRRQGSANDSERDRTESGSNGRTQAARHLARDTFPATRNQAGELDRVFA